MCASTLSVFFLDAAIALVWAGLDSTVSYPRSSRMNRNLSYHTDDDSMTHSVSCGMAANSLRIAAGVFCTLRLDRHCSKLNTWKNILVVVVAVDRPLDKHVLRALNFG